MWTKQVQMLTALLSLQLSIIKHLWSVNNKNKY